MAQPVLAEEHVNLEDVVIGHCGDTTDIDYLMEVADKGCILGMDRFGINFAVTMVERINTIAERVRRGYGDRLTLSHDGCCWSDFFPTVAHYNSAMPQHHYLQICNDVIPVLLEKGITRTQIDRMFIDNPRRHFEAAAKRFAPTSRIRKD